jgi:cell division protein ZapA (FtsZ GTPase activity inhibitor)
MSSTVPITLVNRLKRISGLTRGQEDVLFALARDLDQRHLDLMEKSRRNSVFFKTALNRMSVASKYVNQGKMITP